jgi:hypothetical protein
MRGTDLRNQMLLTWCAPVIIAGTILGMIVLARFIPPPPAYLSAQEIGALYRDHLFSIRFGVFINIGATALLIPFSAAIAVTISYGTWFTIMFFAMRAALRDEAALAGAAAAVPARNA